MRTELLTPPITDSADDTTRELIVALDGMHCAACVTRVQRALEGHAESCDVELTSRTVSIRHDPRRSSAAMLIRRLRAAGFEPHPLIAADETFDAAARRRARRLGLARIGVAVIGAMQVMMLAWPGYFEGARDADIDDLMRAAQALVATPVVFWAGWPFLVQAARALAMRELTMDVPVAASVLIAWLASLARVLAGSGDLYFDAATMFVALLLIGRHLEAATRARASERLTALAQASPGSAMLIVGEGRAAPVPITELVAGDRVRVAPGEMLPVDGRLECAAELDEALLTGESLPVLRHAGDTALAGSFNLSTHPLVLEVIATGARTQVAGILRLLRRAAARKPRLQQFADRVAAHFTLVVLLLAALAGIHALADGSDAAISVVIAVLVASCPCALSLAVPAALAAATSRLAERGVLVAHADRLLRLAEVDTVLFDKTGTLTQPNLQVQRVRTEGPISETQVLTLAATLEQGLVHPIARAFAGIEPQGRLRSQHVQTGLGVSGEIDGRAYRLAPAAAGVTAQDPELTWISLWQDTHCLGHLGLAAALRPQAASVVKALRRCVGEVALLTGDSEAAARHVARLTGIDTLKARQSPEDKLAHLRALQASGATVLAVGDGLNDAPFLAAADVSAAMSEGSAIAQARADLLLVNDRLEGLLLARTVAGQTRRRVRQNLAWAVAYNAAVLPLAFVGQLAPWMAAAGMSLSSLLVVGNALRLRLPRSI